MLIAHIIIYKLDLISIQIQGKENHEALIQYSDNPIDKYKDTTQHIPIHKESMQNSSTTYDAKV